MFCSQRMLGDVAHGGWLLADGVCKNLDLWGADIGHQSSDYQKRARFGRFEGFSCKTLKRSLGFAHLSRPMYAGANMGHPSDFL
jgi:hypothetical protein